MRVRMKLGESLGKRSGRGEIFFKKTVDDFRGCDSFRARFGEKNSLVFINERCSSARFELVKRARAEHRLVGSLFDNRVLAMPLRLGSGVVCARLYVRFF